jgi:Rrf2 family nitric oxide-sensitive transcriptional repressor
MIVTRSVDTALRILIYLARQGARERFLKARQIELDLKVPPFALRKILWSLSRRGLVRSFPGREGGFRLGRTPREISIGEVLAAIEGRVVAYPCRGVDEGCELSGQCTVAPLYQEVEEAMESLLSRYSLQDFLSRPPALPARGGGA